MPTTLKACPFCGSPDVRAAEFKGIFFVVCDECRADGPPADDRDEAVTAWNTRRRPKHDGDGHGN